MAVASQRATRAARGGALPPPRRRRTRYAAGKTISTETNSATRREQRQLKPQRLVRGRFGVSQRSPEQVRHLALVVFLEGQQPLAVLLFEEARFDLCVTLLSQWRPEQQILVVRTHLERV